MMNHHRKCLGFRRINILNSSVLMCAVAFCVAAQMAADPARSQEVPAATRPSDDDLRRSDWIAQGRAKFISACSYCHGSKGDAGKVKSFTERSNWNPQSIHDVITNGRTRGSNVMPPWGGSIADDEIWRIVAYIKSLSTDFKGPIPVENGN